ncbi:MAG: hypothetical protein WCD86_14320 [Ktedonobacteraceae bacterium]
MAKERQVAIFLKPDALVGPYAVVHASLVNDFFSCLLAALDDVPFKEDLRCSSSSLAAKRAFRQITERALSEEAFRIPLRQKRLCQERLLIQMERYKNSNEVYSTKATILQALQAFGFSLVLEKYHMLLCQDIDIIYAQPISHNPALKALLQEYLEDQMICLLLLSGKQEVSALQIVKTYVRYFLRYRDGEQHHLKNLMHVPDGEDLGYLLNLCL